MKKRGFRIGCLGMALAMGISSGLTAQASHTYFSDEFSSRTWDWARYAIYWAYDEGIAVGKEAERFDPDGKMTRAEAATMMANFKGIDANQYDYPSKEFDDVGEKWYTKYINAAYENDLIAGKGNGKFDPEAPLTRAEAAALLVSAMGYEILTEQKTDFEDIGNDWYTNYINTAYAHGMVSGKGNGKFAPASDVTRAEMVTMLYATVKEDQEEALIHSFAVDCEQGSFSLKNEAGQTLHYDETTGEFSGDMTVSVKKIKNSWRIAVPESTSFVFETGSNKKVYLDFYGVKKNINIKGEDVDKVQVNGNGTIQMYSARPATTEHTASMDIYPVTDFKLTNAEGKEWVDKKCYHESGDLEVIWAIPSVSFKPTLFMYFKKVSSSYIYEPLSESDEIEIFVNF